MLPFSELKIKYTQFIDKNGSQVNELPAWAENQELLIEFYQWMVLTRIFDKKAVAFQRTGKLGTFASVLGQEAIGVGIGYAMEKTDLFVPYYRDYATMMIRGVLMREILQYWGGDERGNNYQNNAKDFPLCIPIASQVTHACGVASAFKIRGEKHAVVVTCGDGATSKGDFLESLNLAGAWQLPIVIVVNNNQWAISVPRSIQCAAPTLAQKAVGAGIFGEQVDGNDAIAVKEVVHKALLKARAGKGPTLIEAISYRLCDHTTADDATRYRKAEEVNAAWEREPIKRLQTFLHQRGWWNEKQERQLIESCQAKVEIATQEYLAVEPQTPGAMFDHLYQNLPHSLEQQYEQVIAKTLRLRERE